jgi:hypothetical protein
MSEGVSIRPTDVRPFDYHTMTQLPRLKAVDSAHRALDGVQRDTPEEMMLGVAVLFAALCQRCQVSPHEMHQMGLRVIAYSPFDKTANRSLEALRDFAGLRVLGKETTL